MASPYLDPTVVTEARRARLRRRIIGSVVVLVAIAILAAVFVGVASTSRSRWRTASAGIHDVRSTIDGIASIEPVRGATIAFGVAGTVQTVSVVKGDRVQVGQALAALDPVKLTQTLHSKQASLAKAQLTLQTAIDAQAVAATSTTAPPTTAGPPIAQQIATAQRNVVSAQRTVDTALTQASAAVTASQTPCTSPANPTQIAACQTALANVQTKQAAVQTAQQQLSTATTQLDALLAQQASNGGSGGSTRPTTSVPSAADIVADQAAVDAAQLAVNVAEQNVAATTLTAPIDGTVVSISLTSGQTVTADSTTQTIVIQGPGGFEATMSVSVDLIPRVRVGQDALVLPDSATEPIAARVAQVSLAPSSSATGVTTYRVALALQGSTSGLTIGSIGTASIITASASRVLAVPTSAIHLDPATGDRVVTVLEGSTTAEVAVTIGIMGSDRTQVTAGLADGEVVVLADLRQPLPGTASTARSSTVSTVPGGIPTGGNFPGGGNFQPPTGGFGGGGSPN